MDRGWMFSPESIPDINCSQWGISHFDSSKSIHCDDWFIRDYFNSESLNFEVPGHFPSPWPSASNEKVYSHLGIWFKGQIIMQILHFLAQQLFYRDTCSVLCNFGLEDIKVPILFLVDLTAACLYLCQGSFYIESSVQKPTNYVGYAFKGDFYMKQIQYTLPFVFLKNRHALITDHKLFVQNLVPHHLVQWLVKNL